MADFFEPTAFDAAWRGRIHVLENPGEARKGQRADLEAHYATAKSSFAARRECFQRHGGIYFRATGSGPDGAYEARDRRHLVADLGGPGFYGNWAVTDFPLSSGGFDAVPLTEDGCKFRFVANVSATNCLDIADHNVVLFHDPPSQIALFTFDYT